MTGVVYRGFMILGTVLFLGGAVLIVKGRSALNTDIPQLLLGVAVIGGVVVLGYLFLNFIWRTQ